MIELDRQEFAAECWQALRESEEAGRRRRTNDLTLTMLQKILGADCPADRALFQRPMAENLLTHKDWQKRVAGLVILGWYCKDDCKGDPRLISGIIQIAASDVSLQVRGVAFHTLGRLLQGSRDARVGRYLAELVLDPSLPAATRASAYVGLCNLHGAALPIVHENNDLLSQVDSAVVGYYVG